MAPPRRRLTARSVVLSTLLGTDPPRLPASRLVRAGEIFGISEGTVRTALSRLAADGELTAQAGWYELGERHRARQARQRIGVAPHDSAWDGSWIQVVVTADRRDATTRTSFRADMEATGFAELREGVWLRPDTDRALPDLNDDVVVLRLAGIEDPVALAARLWPVEERRRATVELLDGLAGIAPDLRREHPDSLRTGFELSADVLRHLAGDPLLPTSLDPGAGDTARLRAEYEDFDRRYRALLLAYLRRSTD